MDVEDDRPKEELESRDPSLADLVALCRELNARDARYIVIGGFAIRAAGYARNTMDVDLLVESALANEARVFDALRNLPDQAVNELEPGDLAKFTVVRVADEIVVDLMASAGGMNYADASGEIEWREVDGVPIPFASPRLLWRLKHKTHREKDSADLAFLRHLFAEKGEIPPE
jgi:hypothetical protein